MTRLFFSRCQYEPVEDLYASMSLQQAQTYKGLTLDS
jgi:hypothetical protein